jgi:hypothetical protein
MTQDSRVTRPGARVLVGTTAGFRFARPENTRAYPPKPSRKSQKSSRVGEVGLVVVNGSKSLFLTVAGKPGPVSTTSARILSLSVDFREDLTRFFH